MSREPGSTEPARDGPADPAPPSVLLPTTRGTDGCVEVADQLRDGDELLVTLDDATDPVAGRPSPPGVRLVAARPPQACSGTANAIAAGMEAARHDRLVWTDDDFHHPPDWVATLAADYDRHGPVSEVPYFVGGTPWRCLSSRCWPPAARWASTPWTRSGAARWRSSATTSTRRRSSRSSAAPSATTRSSTSTSR